MAGLLNDVLDIGRGLVRGPAGDELLDPPRIQVDGEQHRVQDGGQPALHLAEHMRTGRTDHQQAAVAQARLLHHFGGMPCRELLLPVRQHDHLSRSVVPLKQ